MGYVGKRRKATRKYTRPYSDKVISSKLRKLKKAGVHVVKLPELEKHSWNFFFLDLCECMEAGTNKLKIGNVYLTRKLIQSYFPYSETYFKYMMVEMVRSNLLLEIIAFDRKIFYVVNPNYAYMDPKPEGLDILFMGNTDRRMDGNWYKEEKVEGDSGEK